MNILLLEDETALREHIKEYLQLSGFNVESYDDGAKMIEEANPQEYDLFILDVNVPGYDGFEILEYLNNLDVTAPVVFITALTQVEDIKKGFDLGCTDYIKKPFELEELVIRIRRLTKKVHDDKEELAEGMLFDMSTKQLYKNGTPVKISKIQKRILYILLKNRGQLVDYGKLVDYVWDGKYVEQNTILSHMRELRKKLPADIIKNYRAEGYTIS